MDRRLSMGSPSARVTKLRDDTVGSKIAASPYLQEHIEARRGRSRRMKHTDIGPRSNSRGDGAFDNNDLFMTEGHMSAETYDKSPINNINNKHNNNRPNKIVSTHATPEKGQNRDKHKHLGARELENHMDKLSKLNFDLKMDLFHCRERMNKLQEQCNSLSKRADRAEHVAEKAEQDKKTLLEINDEMVKELEKRDEAVREAVALICDLEDKVEMLEVRSSAQRSDMSNSMFNLNLDVCGGSSPEGYHRSKIPKDPRQLQPSAWTRNGINRALTQDSPLSNQRRVPSFMSDRKPSTNALRSVYLEPASKLHAVKSYASILSQRDGPLGSDDDDVDDDVLESPHLSILSESSFPSIYSPEKSFNPANSWSDQKQQAIDTRKQSRRSLDLPQIDGSRTSDWVATGQQQQHSQLRHADHENQQQRQDSDDSTVVQTTKLQEPFDENIAAVHPTTTNKRSPNIIQERSRTDSATFSSKQQLYDNNSNGNSRLPPTPESASTRFLRGSSRSSRYSFGAHSRTTTEMMSLASMNRQTSLDRYNTKSQSQSQSRKCLSTSSYSEEEEKDEHNEEDDMSHRLSSGYDDDDGDAVRDIGTEGEREGEKEIYSSHYPSGGSIETGTPSRFQVQHNTTTTTPPSAATNGFSLFDGQDTEMIKRPGGKRRNSGAEEAIRGYESRGIITTTPSSSRRGGGEAGTFTRSKTSPSLLTAGNYQYNNGINDNNLTQSGTSSSSSVMMMSSTAATAAVPQNSPDMPPPQQYQTPDSAASAAAEKRRLSDRLLLATTKKRSPLKQPIDRSSNAIPEEAGIAAATASSLSNSSGVRASLAQKTQRLFRRRMSEVGGAFNDLPNSKSKNHQQQLTSEEESTEVKAGTITAGTTVAEIAAAAAISKTNNSTPPATTSSSSSTARRPRTVYAPLTPQQHYQQQQSQKHGTGSLIKKGAFLQRKTHSRPVSQDDSSINGSISSSGRSSGSCNNGSDFALVAANQALNDVGDRGSGGGSSISTSTTRRPSAQLQQQSLSCSLLPSAATLAMTSMPGSSSPVVSRGVGVVGGGCSSPPFLSSPSPLSPSLLYRTGTATAPTTTTTSTSFFRRANSLRKTRV